MIHVDLDLLIKSDA